MGLLRGFRNAWDDSQWYPKDDEPTHTKLSSPNQRKLFFSRVPTTSNIDMKVTHDVHKHLTSELWSRARKREKWKNQEPLWERLSIIAETFTRYERDLMWVYYINEWQKKLQPQVERICRTSHDDEEEHRRHGRQSSQKFNFALTRQRQRLGRKTFTDEQRHEIVELSKVAVNASTDFSPPSLQQHGNGKKSRRERKKTI